MKTQDSNASSSEQMIQEPKRRFRFNFSMRVLFVVMLGACLAAAFISYEIRLAKAEREQLRKLELLGNVSVKYHYQFNSEGNFDPNAKPRGLASWLSSLAGDQPLYRGVRSMEISQENWDDDWPELTPEQLTETKAALTTFTDLEFFSSDFYPWEDLDSFQNALGLKHLSIAAEPKRIDAISNLKQLEGLVIGDCWQLKDITPIENCTQLKSLDIGGSEILTDLTPFRKLQNLQHLDLSVTWSLTSLKGIEHLANLRSLELRRCGHLADIQDIKALKKLTSLTLTSTDEACDLTPVGQLTSLKQLRLSDNKQVDTVFIHDLTKLESLSLDGCKIKSLDGLHKMKKLDKLFLGGTPIEDASAIHNLPQLTFVSIPGTQLTIDQIKELESKLPRASVIRIAGF